ncbi:MAG: DUF5994 family protein [Kibdelosporangium sp.]
MTPGLHSNGDTEYRPLEPRLTVKPQAAVDWHVGGGWWPRSTDAAVEFPGLVMALSSWIGPVTRVACHFDAWNLAVTRMVTNGWPVVLEDLADLAPNTVMVTGAGERRMTMLVIPPSTPGNAARAMLRVAAARDSVASAEEILRSKGIPA